MYLPPYPPFVSVFPLSKLPYTLCIVVWFTAASYDVDCWDDTILPRSTTAVLYARCIRIQHIVVFIVVVMATMASLRRRHGNWCKLHDAVDCCMLTLINCASIVNTRRSTMHDKRRWAVYYYCCVVIVIVVGGGGIIISICLHLLERWRDRN